MTRKLTIAGLSADCAVWEVDDEAPDFSPPDEEPNPAPTPAADETVVGVDGELASVLSAKGMALGTVGLVGLAGLRPVGSEWVGARIGASGAALTGTRFVPGYGLAGVVGHAPFLGAGITALGLSQASLPTTVEGSSGESEDDINEPQFQAAARKYQLELAERRIRITGRVTEGIEVGLKITGTELPGPYDLGLDIVQMTLGGASFATALQKDGWSPDTALSGLGFFADAVTVASHAVPGLKAVLPYAQGASFVVKVIKDIRKEKPQFEPPPMFGSRRKPVGNVGLGDGANALQRIDVIFG